MLTVALPKFVLTSLLNEAAYKKLVSSQITRANGFMVDVRYEQGLVILL